MNIIIKPVVTEKSMSTVGNNKYTFVVHRFSNKQAIKRAIEKVFNVHIVTISTIVSKGRTMRTGTRRVEKKLSPIKKAIVEIREGEKIGIFEAVK